jgi:N-acetylmuramoyl-L-alanine amidase
MGTLLPLLLSVMLAGPAPAARSVIRPATRTLAATRTVASSSRYEAARTQLRALMRDPIKRRYHHRWEKAIKALLESAVGKDAPAATLEAARARYALYRWSANEADRDAALRLALRAERLGARDASKFAAAIRREAGDERPNAAPHREKPAVAAAPARPAEPKHPHGATATAPTPARPELEAAPEPELEAVVAELKAPPELKLGTSNGAGTASVGDVKAWTGDDYTRIAIPLDHWVGWQKFELPAVGGAPRRLALDFRPARLDGAAQARNVEGDQVDRVRTAQRDPETVRVVFELPGRDDVRFYRLDDPPRLIVDIGTRLAEREARGAARGPAAAAPAPKGPLTTPSTIGPPPPPPPPPPALAGSGDEEGGATHPIRRIVVDAGHGGYDPGAIGPSGVREKDVTLAMSRKLAQRLKQAGFEVVMTRSDDRYVALEERTAIANASKGDLFVSIHANANPRRSLAGVETWILNVADDRYANRLAARENGVDPDDESGALDARRILTDLDARSSTDASRRLAQQVQKEITGSVRERVGEVQDLGVKSALFYVLVGARMPAVLVETAFISNRREEQRLSSARYQDEVAAAVARAVVGFASQQGPRLAAGP